MGNVPLCLEETLRNRHCVQNMLDSLLDALSVREMLTKWMTSKGSVGSRTLVETQQETHGDLTLPETWRPGGHP